MATLAATFPRGIRKWTYIKCGVNYSSSEPVSRQSGHGSGRKKDVSQDSHALDFRKLDIGTSRKNDREFRPRKRPNLQPPRYTRMPVDQNWTNAWPAAHSFKPSVVPLPIRQGYSPKDAPMGKFGNAELMKIPNFLHLTPPAVTKHCETLKKFCTAWPKGLDSDEKCYEHYPLEVITSDYCHSSPTIRDSRARVVTIQLKMGKLELDEHATDKLIRLLGDRYDPQTDTITLVADRCPLRKQNYDYANYLLTALYYESKKIEPWESTKELSDMEKFVWDGSSCQKKVISLLQNMKKESEDVEQCGVTDIVEVEPVVRYSQAVTDIHNVKEDEETTERYKESVKMLLGL